MRSKGMDQRIQPITNLVLDPQATVSGRTWTAGRWFGGAPGAGTHTWMTGATPIGNTFLRKTWTAAPPGNGDTGFDSKITEVPVTPGRVYTISGYLRPSSAGKTARPCIYWRAADGTTTINRVSGTPKALTAGTWDRISYTAVAPAGAAYVQSTIDIHNLGGDITWQVGDYLDGTGLMVTEGSMLYDFGDGNMPGWKWLGTANNSRSAGKAVLAYPWPNLLSKLTSTLEGTEALTGSLTRFTLNGGMVSAARDTSWFVSGENSIKLTPTGVDSYVSPMGDQGAVRMGLTAGKTYTFSGTVRWASDPINLNGARSGSIRVFTKVGAANYVETGPGQNVVVGATRLTHTLTMPAGITEAFVRFYCGSDTTPIWWDQLGVFEHNEFGGPPAGYWVPGVL